MEDSRVSQGLKFKGKGGKKCRREFRDGSESGKTDTTVYPGSENWWVREKCDLNKMKRMGRDA